MAETYEFGFLDELVSISFPSGAAIMWAMMVGGAPKANATLSFVPTNFKGSSFLPINGFSSVPASGKPKHQVWVGGSISNVLTSGHIAGLTSVQNYVGIAKNTPGPATLTFNMQGLPGQAGCAYNRIALIGLKSFSTITMHPAVQGQDEVLSIKTGAGTMTFGWNAGRLTQLSGPKALGFSEESWLINGDIPTLNLGTYTTKTGAVTLA